MFRDGSGSRLAYLGGPTWNYDYRSSKAPIILISRSKVKRPRSAFRTREISVAAKPVALDALHTLNALVQHDNDPGREDGPNLLQIDLGIAEIAKDIAAPLNQSDIFIVHHGSSSLNRLRRARMRSISLFGGQRRLVRGRWRIHPS